MELDAFFVKDARLSVLKEMSGSVFWSTSLPALKLANVDYDVYLCTGSGLLVTCKVPGGIKRVKAFVHEICARASHRYVYCYATPNHAADDYIENELLALKRSMDLSLVS